MKASPHTSGTLKPLDLQLSDERSRTCISFDSSRGLRCAEQDSEQSSVMIVEGEAQAGPIQVRLAF